MSAPSRTRSIILKTVFYVALAAFALFVVYIYRVAHPEKVISNQPAQGQKGQGEANGQGEAGGNPGQQQQSGAAKGQKAPAADDKQKKPEPPKPEEKPESFWEKILDVLGFDREARNNLKQSALGRFFAEITNPIRGLFPAKAGPSAAVAKAAKENEAAMKQQQEMQAQINESIQNNLALVRQTQDTIRQNQTMNQNVKTNLETQRNIRQNQQSPSGKK